MRTQHAVYYIRFTAAFHFLAGNTWSFFFRYGSIIRSTSYDVRWKNVSVFFRLGRGCVDPRVCVCEVGCGRHEPNNRIAQREDGFIVRRCEPPAPAPRAPTTPNYYSSNEAFDPRLPKNWRRSAARTFLPLEPHSTRTWHYTTVCSCRWTLSFLNCITRKKHRGCLPCTLI